MFKPYGLVLISLMAVLTAVLIFSGCATADDGDDGFQLIQLDVIVEEGVAGTPETGTYTYENEEVVFYNYSLEPNYSNLVVTFDGETVESSGTVTITETHTLRATASPVYNVAGTWTMNEEYEDGSFFTVTLVFSGTTDQGTVTDSQGGTGTYVLNDDNSLTFTLDHTDVQYEYEGIFEDSNTMSGDCKRIISGVTYFGSWDATRDEGSTSRKSAGVKYQKNQ